MIKRGGGLLSFGIPVLFVEDDPLKLYGQAPNFVNILCVLQALQTKVKGFL